MKQNITVRSYQSQPEQKLSSAPLNSEEPSKFYLVFDTETLTDASQQIRFGVAHLYKREETIFILHRQWVFYDKETLSKKEQSLLRKISKEKGYSYITIDTFINDFLFWIVKIKAYCVGFNLFFDLTRLAIGHADIYHGIMQDGFSLQLSEDVDAPRIRAKKVNIRSTLYQIEYSKKHLEESGVARKNKDYGTMTYNTRYRGRFIDVATIANCLYSRTFNLDSLCKHLRLSEEYSKLHVEKHGEELTREYIEYAMKDVVATWQCLCELETTYKAYGLSKPIDKLFTEASIGKASLEEMGVRSFLSKNPLYQHEQEYEHILGKIMSSYYGGRSEVKMRRTIVPCLYLDMLSMYPSVNVRMGLWKFVIASEIVFSDVTDTLKRTLATLDTTEKILNWIAKEQNCKVFPTLCKVVSSNDIFPIRMPYDETGSDTIGINTVTCDRALYYMLPDILQSMLLTGKVPVIEQALQFSPKGKQRDMSPIKLLGKYVIDPVKDDMFKRLIEIRIAIKKELRHEKKLAKISTSPEEKAQHMQNVDILDSEQLAVKIITNATSYGIFVELNVERHSNKEKRLIYSYKDISLLTQYKEEPGKYFHPIIASSITSASRLLLAIAEVLFEREGLSWALCDTDSMVACNINGYPEKIFIEKVRKVQEYFDQMYPYDTPVDERENLFKFEDCNFVDGIQDETGKPIPVPMLSYAISAKRYCLFREAPSGIDIIKATEHGLGSFRAPYEGYDIIHNWNGDENKLDRGTFIETNSSGEKTLSICTSPFKDDFKMINPSELRSLHLKRYEYDLWQCILRAEITGEDFSAFNHDAFNVPLRRQYSNTTVNFVRNYDRYNEGRLYRNQVKPGNFYISGKEKFDLFASSIEADKVSGQKEWIRDVKTAIDLGGIKPDGIDKYIYKMFPKEARSIEGVSFYTYAFIVYPDHKWIETIIKMIQDDYTRYQNTLRRGYGKGLHPIAVYGTDNFIDRDTGISIPLDRLDTYQSFLDGYDKHAESKFIGGGENDKGMTQRRHIIVEAIRVTGKEYKSLPEKVFLTDETDLGVYYEVSSEQLSNDMVKDIERKTITDIASEYSIDRKTASKLKTDISSVKPSTLGKVYKKLCETEITSHLTKIEVMTLLSMSIAESSIGKTALRFNIDKGLLSKIMNGHKDISDKMVNKINMILLVEKGE